MGEGANAALESILMTLLEAMNPYFAIGLSLYFFVFILLGTHPIRVTDEKRIGELVRIYLRFFLLVLAFVAAPIFTIFVYFASIKVFGSGVYWTEFVADIRAGIVVLWPLIGLSIIGSALWKLLYGRTIRPAISQFFRHHAVKQSADSLSDIRVEQGNIKPKSFDPRQYYRPDFFFFGLDANGKPIYETDENWKKRHQKCLGPTQTGKGVHQGVQIDQAIRKGMCVFFLDQKPDDFIYDIMRETCAEIGREPPIVVDLNGVGIGNYGPFLYGCARDRRARVLYAFGLENTGQQADYYKTRARTALDKVFDKWDGSLAGLHKLLHPKGATFGEEGEALDGGASDDIYEKSENIRDALQEWMALKPLCAAKGRGLDIERCIKENRIVYIRGSITDKLVKRAETVLVMDLVQTIIRLGKQPHHVYIAMDEVKFIVSDLLATGLATILSKGANCSLAYQSLENLLSLEDKTLNAEAIKSEIEVNTKTTICYQAADNETAEWAAELSGTIQKTITAMEEVEVNAMGAEEFTKQKRLAKEQETLVSANQLKMLPERVAALYRPNELAQLLYTSWVPVKERKGIPLRQDFAEPTPEPKKSPIRIEAEAITAAPAIVEAPTPVPELEKPKAPKPVTATTDAERVANFMEFITGEPAPEPKGEGRAPESAKSRDKFNLPDF